MFFCFCGVYALVNKDQVGNVSDICRTGNVYFIYDVCNVRFTFGLGSSQKVCLALCSIDAFVLAS